MKYLAALPLLAALSQVTASTDGPLDLEVVYAKRPALRHAKPNPPPHPDRQLLASSVVSKLRAQHSTVHASKPQPTKKHTTVKKHTTKKAAKKSPARKAKHTHHRRQATTSSALPGSSTTSAAASCQTQNILYNYVPSPNNATGFIADNSLATAAVNALAPLGYTRAFNGAVGSLYAANYLGYYQLSTYNVSQCASICSAQAGCSSYNIYYERDPVLNPGPLCLNPTAAVSVRCVLYGSTISGAAQAQNLGEWRQNFMIVVSGSNGYNLNTPPPAYTNYTGPTAFLGAVSTVTGASYISSAFSSGVWDPSQCTNACSNLTATNRAAAYANSSATTYTSCNFVNAFQLNYNGTLQGTYCRLYTDSSVIPNANQYTSTTQSGVIYDINNSYGYVLTTPDSGTVSRAAPAAKPAAANYQAGCAAMANSSSTFLDSNSVSYVLSCNSDVPGLGDYGAASYGAGNFSQCFGVCDTTAGCTGFAFSGPAAGSGTCYFKNMSAVSKTMSSTTGVQMAWIKGAYTYIGQ